MSNLPENVAVRAHSKAHKSGAVARIQTLEDGCIGVCAQVPRKFGRCICVSRPQRLNLKGTALKLSTHQKPRTVCQHHP